ncbi:MAG: Ig-like domain-containing protein [Gemmatimonadetes bacterium]|nr:Ig-like domain-containing protein [Gemmatimonadota bacterium]
MRLRRAALAGALTFGGLTACASPGMPPGGPPDVAAPELVATSPDTGAVRVRTSSVTLRFNEVVSERTGGSPGGAGGGTLDALVLLSPGDGRARVNWRRSALEIEPRDGFRPNTTYRLTLLPGLADLRGNTIRVPTEVVFSTGESVSTGALTGAVFDWVAGRAAPLARVEAFLPADTTFRWVARADSAGRFALRNLGPGTYHVRAWVDATPNRQLDSRESFDTLTVAVDTTALRDFYVFSHDTLGPRIEVAEPMDTTALRIRFDRAVAPSWVPDSATFVLLGADSARIMLGTPVPEARYDSLQRVARAAADSVRAAQDTTGPQPRPARVTPPARASADTGSAPRFGRPIPVQNWVAPLLAPLAPGEYRVRVSEAEGLSGARRDSERQFTVRAPPPPKDSVPPAAAARPPRP